MHQEQRNLGMAKLVQGAEAGHRSPGAVAAEARTAEIADRAREFRKRESGGVYLQAINPRRCQALYVFQPADGVARGIHGHVLFMLALNVFAVGRLERFVPIRPTGVRKPGMPADYFREDFLFAGVGKLPIEFARQRQPFVAVEYGFPLFGSESIPAHELRKKLRSSLPSDGGNHDR